MKIFVKKVPLLRKKADSAITILRMKVHRKRVWLNERDNSRVKYISIGRNRIFHYRFRILAEFGLWELEILLLLTEAHLVSFVVGLTRSDFFSLCEERTFFFYF